MEREGRDLQDSKSQRDALVAQLRDGKSGRRADLQGADLVGADLSGVDLSQADLRGADLREADLSGARLHGAQLSEARLQSARLDGAELLAADLRGAELPDAHAEAAGFGGARLEGTNLRGASLRNAVFSRATLVDADLCVADLSGARLQGADLERADLGGAALVDADLAEARVARASFRGADLRKARLTALQGFADADWIGVDLREVDFRGALQARRHILDENYLEEFRNQSPRHERIFRVWQLTSDCGRSFGRWALWTALVVVLFAGLYGFVEVDYGDHSTFLSPVYFSVVTLTTLGYGDVLPASPVAQAVAMLQVAIGYLALGGLLSIFANKMARRAE